MSPNTSYALVLYAPTSNIGLQRTTGFASGTTNSQYTVNSGFTALSTFRNNNNYSNNANSFPSLAISFGENSIPEPTSVFLSAFAGGAMLMRRKRWYSWPILISFKGGSPDPPFLGRGSPMTPAESKLPGGWAFPRGKPHGTGGNFRSGAGPPPGRVKGVPKAV